MNELELRAQAAYQYVAEKLARSVDECANIRAELAARDAQMKALQETLGATQDRATTAEAKVVTLETQLAAQARHDSGQL